MVAGIVLHHAVGDCAGGILDGILTCDVDGDTCRLAGQQRRAGPFQ